VGPIAGHSEQVGGLLEDPARTSYLAVALASEMAVTEVLELQEGLQEQLGRSLAAVVVNGLLPQRFTPAELRRIATLSANGRPNRGAGRAGGEQRGADPQDAEVRRSAALAARTVHDRARFQHNQVARLRRQNFEVLGVPFVWGGSLDLPAVQRVADQLARKL